MIAAFPCYMAVDQRGRIHCGGDVFTVANKAGLAWDWNLHAIKCLALFGHTVGMDTLHPKVYRVPFDTALEAANPGTNEHSLGSWSSVASGSTTFNETLATLKDAFLRDVTGAEVLLSLSAGYDSRVLLSLCLDAGIRPRCVTMGYPDSTDVQVAEAVCSRLGLSHERIEISPEDYLTEGQEIARLTSGTKLAAHWHTYLYSRDSTSPSNEIHLVGSNGEFARNFYIPDRFGPLRVMERSPANLFPLQWTARLEKRRAHFRSLPLVSSGGFWQSFSIARSLSHSRKNLGSALAQFYATQRVRHFIGNGLALYSAFGKPRSPFLDGAVVNAIRGLSTDQFNHDQFHKRIVQGLAPRLMEFPFNSPMSNETKTIPYSPFPQVVAMPKTRDVVMEHSSLDDLVPQQSREHLLKMANVPVVDLLLTLAFAARQADRTPMN
jgi:Asparagine synthase